MAAYSPPTTPQIDPDIREDLLRCLDQEIQATQVRHDEAQRRLLHERRCATTHDPFDEQFENAEEMDNQGVNQHIQHDYSFNLTGIIPPQPPKWKQFDHLYEDLRNSKDPVPMHLKDQWLMYQTKLRWTHYFCGVAQMVRTYMKDLTYPYINSMIWISFGLYLTSIVSQFVTFVLQDGNLGLLPRLHLKLLILSITGFLSWPNSVNLNQQRKNPGW